MRSPSRPEPTRIIPAILAALGLVAGTTAGAQEFPLRPIRIVTTDPGSGKRILSDSRWEDAMPQFLPPARRP